MSAIHHASMAYRAQVQTVGTARGLEYDILARLTRQLRDASIQAPESIGPLAAAIHDNRRLWTLFAVEAADEGNPLPRDLRARILSLAEFVRRHGGKVLREGASLEPLIEINMAVMRGLTGQGGGQ